MLIVMVDGDSAAGLAWMRDHLPLSPLRTETKKGEHWAFRHPGVPVKNKVRIKTGDLAIKIDVRGDGGYVVAPGSLHASRVTYLPIGTWPSVSDRRRLPRRCGRIAIRERCVKSRRLSCSTTI